MPKELKQTKQVSEVLSNPDRKVNSWVYRCKGSETCTSIYIMNPAILKLGSPKKIKLTIEALD